MRGLLETKENDTLTRMIAVQLENRRVSIIHVPKPRRPPGYSRIRLLCGGICNTDLELLEVTTDFQELQGTSLRVRSWIRTIPILSDKESSARSIWRAGNATGANAAWT